MKPTINNKHTGRFVYALIFAMVFTFLGETITHIYHQYFDKTNYISFAEPITFDKKLYAPCDKMQALIKLQSMVSTPTVTRYSLRLIEDGTFKVVQESEKAGFVKRVDGVEPISVDFQLPCNLSAGSYFFTGIITYQISGVVRNYDFITDQFSVAEPTPSLIILQRRMYHA